MTRKDKKFHVQTRSNDKGKYLTALHVIRLKGSINPKYNLHLYTTNKGLLFNYLNVKLPDTWET